MRAVKSKFKFELPHVYIIVISMVIIAAVLSWIIPAGEFDRVINESTGQKVVVPGAFRFIESSRVSLWTIPLRLVQGLINTSEIAVLLLISGGSFGVIIKTGMIQSLTSFMAKKFSEKEFLVIPAFIVLFSIAGMVVSGNAIIGFAPLAVIIARSLGYDAVVGVAMVCLAVGIGFSTGPLNPNTTAIAQAIGGLPLFSGMWYRLISWFIFVIITSLYTLSYARKIKKNPNLSVIHEIESEVRNAAVNPIIETTDTVESVQRKHGLVAMVFILGFIYIMYGSWKLNFQLPQISSVFLVMAVLSGVLGGFSLNETAKEFVIGAKGTVFGLFLVGFSRSISSVLADGRILDTTIYYLSESLSYIPSFAQAGAMYVMQVLVNGLIISGSGQATATMPIVLPVGDLIGMTRQTVVLSFNFGDGFSNYILPTSSALMGFLGMAGVPYDRWMWFMGKLFLIWSVVAIILLTIAHLMNYGPF